MSNHTRTVIYNKLKMSLLIEVDPADSTVEEGADARDLCCLRETGQGSPPCLHAQLVTIARRRFVLQISIGEKNCDILLEASRVFKS